MFKALGSATILLFAAFSSSNTYELQNYNIGSGGTNTSSSSSYKLNASTGEVGGGTSSGSADKLKASSIEAQQANVPLAPTLGNGSGTFYNKLSFVINMSSDPSDYTYAVAVSTASNFATTYYVQADGTLGSSQVYRTYAAWGGGSGSTIVGLLPNTTYYVKVAAMQGQFTNSAFGPSANIATVSPQLSFSLSPSSINLGSLLAGTVITAGTNVSVSFATNAGTGGNVYIAGANAGLNSTAASNTISAVSADLAAQPQGFGLRGLTASATSGTFSISSPFDGSNDVVGGPGAAFQPIFTTTGALVGGSATAAVKAKASATTPASGDYQEILTFVASASF
jgi:hypothetical protein